MFILPILYLIIVCVILWMTIQQYFEENSRFEDYYITVAVFCSVLRQILLVISTIFNTYDFRYVTAMHFLDSFGFWFMLIFLVKQINFKSRNTSRALNLLITVSQILVFSGWALFLGNPMKMTSFPSNASLLMKLGTIPIYSLNLFVETSQLIIVGCSLYISHRLRNLLMNLSVSFLFVSRLFHFLNDILYTNSDMFFFYLEHTFKTIFLLALGATISTYYKNRTTFFINKNKKVKML